MSKSGREQPRQPIVWISEIQVAVGKYQYVHENVRVMNTQQLKLATYSYILMYLLMI